MKKQHPAEGRVVSDDPTGLPDMLPSVDECASCRRPKGEHKSWIEGGHDFRAPAPRVNPAKAVEVFIETSWRCWSCGKDNDVWGVGDGWIECGSCGANCYLGA